MDKYGVIWTRVTGQPLKLAEMVLTPSELRITKTTEAIQLGLPGVSILHDKMNQATIIFHRTQNSSLPPQLKALMPPRTNNPQYAILSKLLERHINVRGMPIIEQEWEMLLFAGRDAIGHLDVFKSDKEAERYYSAPIRPDLDLNGASALWLRFKRIAENSGTEDDDIDEILETVGPTPGVTGFNPKLLTSIVLDNQKQWDGRLSEKTGTHVLAKIDTPIYPGIISLERLCYHYHERAGLVVPQLWSRNFNFSNESVNVLAAKRFDRADDGRPVPIESLWSVLRTGTPSKFYSTTDASMEDVWKAVNLLSVNTSADRIDLFKRFVLSFLTGNGDLHLENWSILGSHECARLSPVYDPAPMRAYRSPRSNHDILSALSFSGIGGMDNLPYAMDGKTPDDLFMKVCDFGYNIGLSRPHSRNLVIEMLEVTADYIGEAIETIEAARTHHYRPKAPDIDGFATTLKDVRKAMM
jgi:serine/threonine-protein kinase HipA